MKTCYHIIQNLIFAIALLVGFNLDAQGQSIEGPEKILTEFRNELINLENRKIDSLEIYRRYAKKLTKRGNFLHADTLFRQLSTMIKDINDSSIIADIYKDRAFMYKVQRKFTLSLEDYLWLKSYYEQKNDGQAKIEIYTLLAEYYRAVWKYDLTNSHLKLAEEMFKTIEPSTKNLAYWYSRKAAWSNEALGNQDSVVYYAQKGLDLAKNTDDFYTQALLLNELGYSYLGQKKEEAYFLDFFYKARDLLYEHEYYRDYIDVMNNISGYYFLKGDNEKTIKIIEDILPIEEINQWYDPLVTSISRACAIYQSRGEKEKFDLGLHKYYEASLKNMESIHAVALDELFINYEKNLAIKELEVQAQKTKVAQKEALSNKRAFIISMVIAVVLLLLALISFQISLRFRRKNELLSEQRNQIQIVNSELEKSLEQQRLLFKELNHRVKNNLSILTGLIYLQEVAEGNENLKTTLGTLRNRIKSMALAHESLYNAEQVEKIDFQNYLNALFLDLTAALSFGNKIKVQIDCEGFKLDLKQAVPVAMIINELFTNSIKHGYKESQQGIITVKAYHGEAFSTIEYTDDGVGFGKKDAKNRTLGLRLVNLLSEQLDAKLIDRSEEKGVSFLIEIPNP